MSTGLQLYTIIASTIDGLALTEAASISIKRDLKLQQIDTILKGLAGWSPGAAFMEVTIEGGVPAADFELNPGKYMGPKGGGPRIIEASFYAASKVMTSKMVILDDNFQQAVNQAARLTMRLQGEYADWR